MLYIPISKPWYENPFNPTNVKSKDIKPLFLTNLFCIDKGIYAFIWIPKELFVYLYHIIKK